MVPRFDALRMIHLLTAVGAHLEAEGSEAAVVVVGGAALALRGWVPRTTQDVDVIALADESGTLRPPPLPEPLVRAVERVARDFNLPDHWLNAVVGARSGERVSPTGLQGTWNGDRSTRCGLASPVEQRCSR